MRIYSYVIEHDLGFAPNPFFGTCTLACCKPKIRQYAEIGDIVVGTGSKGNNRQGYIIYWMRVDRIIGFDDYWMSPRFSIKKPNMNGSAIQRYGDNIYKFQGQTGEWAQLNSFHSQPDGSSNMSDLERDTGTTDRVLLGKDFAYWGGSGSKIPDMFSDFIVKTQGHKCRHTQDRVDAFMAWLSTFDERGYIDEPTNWKNVEI